ncbi:hypothetical protein K502DRAFT_349448 [Neoconidiobolus thromboides FSU 785]|nr:hypothetical protein K502DRAFT_349448 [Neoconidiobolus thromboides FSU 785]
MSIKQIILTSSNNYNTTTTSNKLSYRCDQCNHRCIKCDKKQPKCSSCIAANIECTLLRRIKNKKQLAHIQGIITFDSTNKNKLKYQQYQQLENIQSNLKTIKDKDIDIIINLMHEIKNKNILSNLLTLLQYPNYSIPNKGIQFLLSLLTQLKFKVNNKQLKLVIKDIKFNYHLKYNPILSEAVNLFFKYKNQLFSCLLIEKKDYNNLSLNLKLIILSLGLYYQNKTEAVTQLLNYLSHQLYLRFNNILSIPPTLINIQTILLLLNLRCFKWVNQFYSYLLYYCMSSTYVLGLHLPIKSTNIKFKLSRQLIFNYLGFHTAYTSILTFSYIPVFVPYKSKYRSYHQLKEGSILTLLRKKDIGDAEGSIQYTLLFNDYLADLAPILLKCSILKDQVIKKKEDFNSLLLQILQLFKRIEKSKKQYLNLLITWNDNNSSTKATSQILQSMQQNILILSHYTTFFLYSLNFYHSNPLASKLKKKSFQLISSCLPHINSTYKNLLQLCFYEVKQVIVLCSQLNGYYFEHVLVTMLVQCIVFLIRFQKEEEAELEKMEEAIKLAQETMTRLKQFPHLVSLVEYNNSFLNQLNKVEIN